MITDICHLLWLLGKTVHHIVQIQNSSSNPPRSPRSTPTTPTDFSRISQTNMRQIDANINLVLELHFFPKKQEATRRSAYYAITGSPRNNVTICTRHFSSSLLPTKTLIMATDTLFIVFRNVTEKNHPITQTPYIIPAMKKEETRTERKEHQQHIRTCFKNKPELRKSLRRAKFLQYKYTW